jgi:hypothetical protein
VRAATLGLLAAAAPLLMPACGGDGGGGGSPTDQALACIEESGVPARKVPPHEIEIGPSEARVEVFRTVADAESAELADRAPGAEQIGRALLHVDKAPEDILRKVELCLEELAK